jgi:hypothetical protein
MKNFIIGFITATVISTLVIACLYTNSKADSENQIDTFTESQLHLATTKVILINEPSPQVEHPFHDEIKKQIITLESGSILAEEQIQPKEELRPEPVR